MTVSIHRAILCLYVAVIHVGLSSAAASVRVWSQTLGHQSVGAFAAAFGAHTYNVSTQLVAPISANSEACEKLDNSPGLAGNLVLVKRGSCPFGEKAYHVQQAGGVGMIVGNSVGTLPLRMGLPQDFPHSIHIPAVCISKPSYDIVHQSIADTSQSTFAWVSGTADDDDSNDPRKPDYRLLSSVILLMPATLATCFCVMMVKRRLQALVLKWERESRSQNIPIVTYHLLQDEPSRLEAGSLSEDEVERRPLGPVAASDEEGLPMTERARAYGTHGSKRLDIINETCAICLDDFEEGSDVKLLPCMHAYHQPCIDPWLHDRSDLCPTCKRTIINERRITWIRRLCCIPASQSLHR